MRNLILGGIGVALGLAVVGHHFLSGPAPRRAGGSAFQAGQTAGLLCGVALLVAGGVAVGRELIHLKAQADEERWERDRAPARRRRKERRPATDPVIVAAGVGGAVLLVAALGGVGWYLLAPSRPAETGRGPSIDPVAAGPASPNQPPHARSRSSTPAPPAGPPVSDPGAVEAALANLRSRHAHERADALTRLVRLAPDHRRSDVAQAVERLLDEDRDPRVHAAALSAFAAWADRDRAYARLIALMTPKSRPPEVVRALGVLKDPRAAAALAACLPADHNTAAAAMEALTAIGPPSEAEVRKYLTHADLNARHRAAQVMKSVGTAASLEELQRAAAAEQFGAVRSMITDAIAAIKSRAG